MASTFHHTFKWDNSNIGGGSNDTVGICPGTPGTCSIDDSAKHANATLCTDAGGIHTSKNYSKTFIMPSQANDFAFCAICTVCDCEMSLEMSPDGINWCPCVDGADKDCTGIGCSSAVGACNCKVVSAPMMQYVRAVLHDGDAQGGLCTVTVHWTTF